MLIAISFSNPGLKCSPTLYMPGGMQERFANAKRAREVRGSQTLREPTTKRADDKTAIAVGQRTNTLQPATRLKSRLHNGDANTNTRADKTAIAVGRPAKGRDCRCALSPTLIQGPRSPLGNALRDINAVGAAVVDY